MKYADKRLELLLQFDSCTVSDAIDSLQLAEAVSGLRRQSGSSRTVGKAITVQLVKGTPPPENKKIHLGARACELADQESVIVISHPGIDAGGWGGVLTRAAIERGVNGVILDGATRDVDEARELDFPIYAKSVTPKTARNRLFESSTNAPVTIGGCRVYPGDYTLADDSGVVFVRPDHIDQVLEKAAAIQAKESQMIKRIESDWRITDVLGADYEDMLD